MTCVSSKKYFIFDFDGTLVNSMPSYSKVMKQVLDEAGGKLAGFAYFVLGEGIEKREDNLADEVAKMLH